MSTIALHSTTASQTASPALKAEPQLAARSRLGRWALLFGVWSIPGILSTSQIYFLGQMNFPAQVTKIMNISFRAAFIWQFPPWLCWALFTPILLRLGKRFPFEKTRIVTSAAVHLLAIVVAASLHFAAASVCGRLAGQEFYTSKPFQEVLAIVFVRNIHLDIFAYMAVLALIHAYEYHNRYREREIANARLETELAQAELEALKMQLHPHFLFNTLNAISILVRKRETQASVRMITGLSDLLRMALDNVGRQLVSLKQEIDFVSRYLEIEKTRFADRLTVDVNVAADALNAEVPNLLLQPIVENAIRHGIAPRASSGHIEIRAEIHDKTLLIQVSDNGLGLPKPWNVDQCKGVGLKNIKARLEQLYGVKHQFNVDDKEGGGVVVRIEIPFRLASME